MNRFRFAWPIASLLLILPGAASAQAASECATFTQIISGTEIEIAWSRRSLRGRDVIFGRQIPWGAVWTPGANMATTIRFSKDVVLSGTPVPAGRYSVWLRVLETEPWVGPPIAKPNSARLSNPSAAATASGSPRWASEALGRGNGNVSAMVTSVNEGHRPAAVAPSSSRW